MENIIDKDSLEKLPSLFPREFVFEGAYLKGAYLKGVLFDVNGDIQLTYSIIDKEIDKTHIFVFIFSDDCKVDNKQLQIPTDRSSISGLDIRQADDKVRFTDTTNGNIITCKKIKLDTHVILSKVYGKEQARKLTDEYSKKIEQKFNALCQLKPLSNGKPLFRRDDSYNGISASHHTMYKLEDLHNEDDSIKYEFLIEFDRNAPCLGIYYGCKGIIQKGDNRRQQDLMLGEWEKSLKAKVQKRLENTFPDKKFGYRFKPTDNANDNTFWPFWVSLHEDENILEVAVRATIIIRDEYKRYLEGENYKPDETSRYALMEKIITGDDEVHSETLFTVESYNELLENKKAFGGNKDAIRLFERFLQNAEQKVYLTRDTRYEKAWKIGDINGAKFSFLLKTLFNNKRFKNLKIKSAPWKYLARVFLNEKGKAFTEDGFKNQASQVERGNNINKTKEKWECIIEQLLQEK